VYSFSPDGKNLAFTDLSPDAEQDIWVLPLDTADPERPRPGKPQILVRTPAADLAPAFSPDGKWIAYASGETGRIEVIVRPFPIPADGSPGGKWQISVNGGNRPVWSRTAPELFFVAPDNRILVAGYKTSGQSFDGEKPRVWSNTQIVPRNALSSAFDLSPDGRHVAALVRSNASGEQKGSVHINVLLNFSDELRRRVPVGK
jgi:serine/threonine-protein kinase